jgi:hypothetical protein
MNDQKQIYWNTPMNKNVISCQVNDLSQAPDTALFDFANKETVRRVSDRLPLPWLDLSSVWPAGMHRH